MTSHLGAEYLVAQGPALERSNTGCSNWAGSRGAICTSIIGGRPAGMPRSASTRRNWSRSRPTSSWRQAARLWWPCGRRVASSHRVVLLVADPVGAGFVESGARPGGNATGFPFEYTIGAKWLEVLREVAPRVRRVAVLREATNPGGIGQFVAIQSAAATHGGASHPRGFRCRRDLAGTLPADRLDDLAHKLDVGIILGERLLSELIINLKTAAPRPSTHDREDP